MATKIRKCTNEKQVIRFKRKRRIQGKISGTLERPRLVLFRSNKHIYVQLVDDIQGQTLIAASTLEKALKQPMGATLEGAKALGGLVAERALQNKIATIVFDRSGYLYHGRVKALADAAREGGLKF